MMATRATIDVMTTGVTADRIAMMMDEITKVGGVMRVGGAMRVAGVTRVGGVGIIGLRIGVTGICLLYTSPSPRDRQKSRMPSSA